MHSGRVPLHDWWFAKSVYKSYPSFSYVQFALKRGNIFNLRYQIENTMLNQMWYFSKPETLNKDCYRNFCAGQKIQRIFKIHKGNIFKSCLTRFSIFTCWNNLFPKSDNWVQFQWSRLFFRHQYWANWLMSYFDVIWVIQHQMLLWHQMTHMTSIFDISWFGQPWCLKKRLNHSNSTCWSDFS